MLRKYKVNHKKLHVECVSCQLPSVSHFSVGYLCLLLVTYLLNKTCLSPMLYTTHIHHEFCLVIPLPVYALLTCSMSLCLSNMPYTTPTSIILHMLGMSTSAMQLTCIPSLHTTHTTYTTPIQRVCCLSDLPCTLLCGLCLL